MRKDKEKHKIRCKKKEPTKNEDVAERDLLMRRPKRPIHVISLSASEKHNQEKKAHKPLRTSWISQKKMSAMFDNHTILLFWLKNKQTFRMFSLCDLRFTLCSL